MPAAQPWPGSSVIASSSRSSCALCRYRHDAHRSSATSVTGFPLDRATDGYQALQADPPGKIRSSPPMTRARSGSARGCATTTENTKQALHDYADQLAARIDASQPTELARIGQQGSVFLANQELQPASRCTSEASCRPTEVCCHTLHASGQRGASHPGMGGTGS
jgi:hypothetical protein